MLLGLRTFSQHYRVDEVVIEADGVVPVLAQLVDFDVPWEVTSIFSHLEHLVLHAIINEVIIAQFLNQIIHWTGGGEMNMMHYWFRHEVEALIKR